MAITKVEESLRLFKEMGDYYASVWPGLEMGHLAVWLGDHDRARQFYEDVLKEAQDNDFDWAAVKATRYLGNIATIVGDYEKAWAYLTQSLTIAEELGLMRDMVSTLYDIATVEAAAGDVETAVRLLALIRDHPLSDQTRTFSVWSGSRSPHFRDLADELLDELESRLPPEAYVAAVARGRALDLHTVVTQRLEGNR